MGLLTDPTVKDDLSVQRNFDSVARRIFAGRGTPEGNIAAGKGSIYMREDGADNLLENFYVKKTGPSSKTGWVGLA